MILTRKVIVGGCGRPVFMGRPSAIAVPGNLVSASERPFFNRAVGRKFDVRDADDVTEVELYDEIGFWGVTAKDFRSQIAGKGRIRLRINSPGGDVFDGITIFNDLLDHPAPVDVEIVGIAASAASIIAMAGDTVTIADNAFLMIHNAWTIGLGDRHEMLSVSETLEQIDSAIADTYVARTGSDRQRVVQMMDDETWMKGKAAVDAGFADEVAGTADVKAAFDVSGFRNSPSELKVALGDDGRPSTVRDAERALRDAGFSRANAKALASRAFDTETLPQRDADGADPKFVAALNRLLAAV